MHNKSNSSILENNKIGDSTNKNITSSVLSYDKNDNTFKAVVEQANLLITPAYLGIGEKNAEDIKKYTEKYTKEFVNNKLKESENRLKKMENKIENSQIRIVETLGIFVALFTFISTEFQAFKIYQSLKAIAGLSLIMLGGLLIFIIILNIVLMSSKIDKDATFNFLKCNTWSNVFILKFVFLILCLFFIVFGVILLSTSKEKNRGNNYEEECIYKNYINTNSSLRF